MTQLSRILFRADQAVLVGDWEEAQQLYQEARALDPDNTRAEMGLRNVQKLVDKADSLKARIAAADALLAQGNYKSAADEYIAIIDYAVAPPRILRFNQSLERKRHQAKELHRWQERLQKTLREARQLIEQGNWKPAAKFVEGSLQQLPKEQIYQPMRDELLEMRASFLVKEDHRDRVNKAKRLLYAMEYEQSIVLLEKIPPDSPLYPQARRGLRLAHSYLNAQKSDLAKIEAAINEGQWTEALELLELRRELYQDVPHWQQLYLEAGTACGHHLLNYGRQLNTQRDFSKSRQQLNEAREIFEKVLVIYPTDPDVQTLHNECEVLVAVTTYQAQAQLHWEKGKRDEAEQALILAQKQLMHAQSAGYDYPVIEATVDSMLNDIQAESKRILEEVRRLRCAENLLEKNHLSEAYQLFMESLDALLSEQRRQAIDGLSRVEAKLQPFDALMAKGNAAKDPIVAVNAYQDAYDLWSDAPNAADALENALLKASQYALNAGHLIKAADYANRALLLNPDNHEAKSCLTEIGIKPQIKAILQRVCNEWKVLQRKESIESAMLDPLLRDIENALNKVSGWHNLRNDLERMHGILKKERGLWVKYEQAYIHAGQLRDNGEWIEALRALEQVVIELGDEAHSGIRRQLGIWRKTIQVLENVYLETQVALKQANATYLITIECDTLFCMVDALDAVSCQLKTAYKQLHRAEKQVVVAGGQLPKDLVVLQKQVKDLDKRTSAASEAASTLFAFDGLRTIQKFIHMHGSDPTLKVVKAKLEEKACEDIAGIKQQAQTAIQAGDLAGAEEKLHQVCKLDPSDTETATLYADIRQRRQLEARLRQIEREAEGKLASNSPMDAMRTFRQGLNVLLEPDVVLPEAAREILSDLIALGDGEDGLALGQPENWDMAQALMASLGKLRAENWAAGRAVRLMDQWIRLARDITLRRIVSTATQLGDFLGAYSAASAYIKAHPTDTFAVEQLSECRQALIRQVNEPAMRRIELAQRALEDEDYKNALYNLQNIESDFYRPIEEKFPGFLDGCDEVQDVRKKAKQLKEKSESLQAIYLQVQPHLERARQAYLEGAWDAAEKAIESLPSIKGASNLKAEINTLRKQITKAQIEQTKEYLYEVMNYIETKRHLATKIAQLDTYLEDMEALQREINFQVLAVEERSRYFQILEEVREQREALVAGTIWEQQIEEFMQKQQYADALKAIEKALAATREAGKRVKLEMRRDEIEHLAQEQQEREAALNQGHNALAEEDYVAARQHFEKARRLGADVAEVLAATRAGGLLQSAWRFWEVEHDADSALLDLDEVQRFVEGNNYAATIADEARYLYRHIETARQDTLEVQRALAKARRLLAEGQLSAAQDSVQQILERDPAFPDALALQKQIQEQAVARAILDKAHAAQQEGQYKESLRMVNTVLETQPDNLKAKLLQRQLNAEISASIAVIEVETLTKQHHFKQAREKLTELSRQGVDPDTLRQTQDLVDELEKEQWTRVVHPIQELYRDGEYAEAWNRCKQALGRTAAPELLDELQTLQKMIKNRQAEIRGTMRQCDIDIHTSKSEILLQKAWALQKQWETDAQDKITDEADLEQICELANGVFKIPGSENDGRAQELLVWVEQERSPNARTRRFFCNGGFNVNIIEGKPIYKCVPTHNSLKRLIQLNAYTMILPDKVLDRDQVLIIHKEIQELDIKAKVVFVLTNHRPTVQGWAQIGTLRLEGFTIIPLEQRVMQRVSLEGQEKQFLRKELNKRLGTNYDPYDIRDPVADAFSFFGHDALIRDLLHRSHQGQPVGIFGLRKLGKSSLLRALRDQVDFPVALIDLQMIGQNGLDEVYSQILYHWQQWCRVHYDLDFKLLQLDSSNATGVFTTMALKILERIDAKIGEARLGLFLDEVEVIVPYPDGKGPDLKRYLTLLRALRGLMDNDGCLSLVVASLNPSINRINAWSGQQNPVFNRFQEIYLPPLMQEDCVQMIRNIGGQIGLSYNDVCVKQIADLSGGHPFLARQFCSMLYKERDYQSGAVSKDALPATIKRFVHDARTIAHIDAGIWQDAGNTTLWGEKQSPVNQDILLDLARAPEPLSEAKLLERGEINNRYTALIDLERFHFIYQPKPGYYALRYGLLRTWLRHILGLE